MTFAAELTAGYLLLHWQALLAFTLFLLVLLFVVGYLHFTGEDRPWPPPPAGTLTLTAITCHELPGPALPAPTAPVRAGDQLDQFDREVAAHMAAKERA